MAGEIKFFWENYIDADAYTLTVTSEHADYPKENLRSLIRQEVWKTAAAAEEQWVKLDLGAGNAKDIKVCCASNHLLTGDIQTLQMQFEYTNDDGDWNSGGSVDFYNIVQGQRNLVAYKDDDIAYRYYRVRSWTTSGLGHAFDWRLGRLFIGNAWTPSAPLMEGFSVNPILEDKIGKTRHGVRYARLVPVRFKFSGRLGRLTDDDACSLREMLEAVGRGRPFFLLPMADEAHVEIGGSGKYSKGYSIRAMYGRLASLSLRHLLADRSSFSFTFEEDR